MIWWFREQHLIEKEIHNKLLMLLPRLLCPDDDNDGGGFDDCAGGETLWQTLLAAFWTDNRWSETKVFFGSLFFRDTFLRDYLIDCRFQFSVCFSAAKKDELFFSFINKTWQWQCEMVALIWNRKKQVRQEKKRVTRLAGKSVSVKKLSIANKSSCGTPHKLSSLTCSRLHLNLVLALTSTAKENLVDRNPALVHIPLTLTLLSSVQSLILFFDCLLRLLIMDCGWAKLPHHFLPVCGESTQTLWRPSIQIECHKVTVG